MKKTRIGIIDIGSHSVLLLIAEYQLPGGWQVIEDRVVITRLGEGFGAGAMLNPSAAARTLQVIDEFLTVCKTHGVHSVIAVGTAVLRQAVNRQEFADALLARGIGLRILSEREEAELSYLSVRNDSKIKQSGTLAIIDIGGGSVEVAYGKERVQEWFSFPVGALRVREEWMPTDLPSAQETLNACVKLDETFAPLKQLPYPDTAAAVGGTGVTLASVWMGLEQYDPLKLHAFEMEYEHVGKLLERLGGMTEIERRRIKGMDPERAPVIHAGALILERVLFALRQEKISISVRGLRYGLLPSNHKNRRENPVETP